MAETEKPTSRAGGRRLRLLKYVIAVPVIALIWWFVIGHLRRDFAGLEERGWRSLHIHWHFLLMSLALLMAARLTNALNCRLVLASMGAQQPLRNILPIIWVTSLGRYLPGRVSVVAGALVGYMRLGIRVPVALASLFLATALSIVVSLVVSSPMLFLSPVKDEFPHGWIVGAVVLAGAAVLLHPNVFARVCNLLLMKLKHQRLPERLHWGAYLAAMGTTVARIAFLGLALYTAARGLVPVAWSRLPLFVGSAALASFAGFLMVLAPAGLGVHEGIYILTLQAVVNPLAGILAILFRLLNIVGDAIAGLVGMIMLRSHPALSGRGRAADGATSTEIRAVL